MAALPPSLPFSTASPVTLTAAALIGGEGLQHRVCLGVDRQINRVVGLGRVEAFNGFAVKTQVAQRGIGCWLRGEYRAVLCEHLDLSHVDVQPWCPAVMLVRRMALAFTRVPSTKSTVGVSAAVMPSGARDRHRRPVSSSHPWYRLHAIRQPSWYFSVWLFGQDARPS